ncbi:thymidylate synthase [Lysinibacillus phage LC76P1]|nr:thymidylate synthase [Lysinibacillus phage LC76P1]
MKTADEQYKELVTEILAFGYDNKGEKVRTKYKTDGLPAYTKSLISRQFRFKGLQVPILTSKFVAWKWAIKELLWIWQMKSNRLKDLQDMGVTIWDDWELADGTIGKAYGYQLREKRRPYAVSHVNTDLIDKNNTRLEGGALMLDQVDALIHELINNPSSRRHITTLFCVEDLPWMALHPCVYETQWYVRGNVLNLEVRARSNDIALGNPFNVFQYYVLLRMIAQVTGYEVGEYIFNMGDAHIYDRHEEAIKQQIGGETFAPPELWINPEITNFYDFTPDDFELIGYNWDEKYEFEVAI